MCKVVKICCVKMVGIKYELFKVGAITHIN